MAVEQTPTARELEILKVLWDRGEASVRAVYEEMSRHAPIVQNTVQAFLRTMEDKGLVRHRTEGRSFVYRPVARRDETKRRFASLVLDGVFAGAIDQLVQSVLSLRRPTPQELRRLEDLIRDAKSGDRKPTASDVNESDAATDDAADRKPSQPKRG